ncbi:hypothetical protein ACVWZD_007765 [Streptomyces sp. TE3672]
MTPHRESHTVALAGIRGPRENAPPVHSRHRGGKSGTPFPIPQLPVRAYSVRRREIGMGVQIHDDLWMPIDTLFRPRVTDGTSHLVPGKPVGVLRGDDALGLEHRARPLALGQRGLHRDLHRLQVLLHQ